MRSGKCVLGLSKNTWRLDTRKSRPPCSNRKPLALVSGALFKDVVTRAQASSKGSIDEERLSRDCVAVVRIMERRVHESHAPCDNIVARVGTPIAGLLAKP